MASKEIQEALELVKSYLRTDNAYVITVAGEAIKTLQELIDNYDKLEKELLKLEVDYNNLLSSSSLEIEKLEKELEKYKNLYEQYRFERDIENDYKELYKKALKLIIKDTSDLKVKKDDCFVKFVCSNTNCNECIENNYLIKARNEIENDRK